MKDIFHHFRHPITIFLIGWIIKLFGAMEKVMHHSRADQILWVGTGLQIFGIVLSIVLLFKLKASK